MNTKNLLLTSALCIAACSSVLAEVSIKDGSSDLKITLSEQEAALAKKIVLQKPQIALPTFVWEGNNDVALKVGGQSKNEARRAHQAETLNKKLPDRVGDFNNRFDLTGSLVYGEKTYGMSALEIGVTRRLKYVAGDWGKFNSTAATSGKVTGTDIVQDIPASSLNLPIDWFKHLWTRVSLNALFDIKHATQHSVQVGMFDFSLGRGIAYGPFYGVTKPYLGLFSSSTNDFAPFGLLVHGDIVKDKLSYDLYWARLEENGDSLRKTAAKVKGHLRGRSQTPERGVGKTNDVYAFRTKFIYDLPRFGDLSTETYFMYNDASDQMIERLNDSKSQLFTTGWMGEFSRGNFEFGWDMAFNRGHEEVFAIDRNDVVPAVIDEASGAGTVTEVYSHVVGINAGNRFHQKSVPVYSATTDIVAKSASSANGATLTTSAITLHGVTAYQLANRANRFREYYKNNYRGWMAVVDAAYSYKPLNIKFAVAAGHSSGDNDPHQREENKNYQGFVGLHEAYAGTRVQSVFVLNARKMKQPLTITPETDKILSDPSFSDMTYVGTGVEWRSKCRKLKVTSNALGYWKDKAAFKYFYDENNNVGSTTTEAASRFMGVEGNVGFEIDLLAGLKFGGQFALFLPGQYYTDIKGVPVSARVDATLDASDKTGVTQAIARMSDDIAFYGTLGFEYKF